MRYTKPSATIQYSICDKEVYSRGLWGHIKLFHPEYVKELQEKKKKTKESKEILNFNSVVVIGVLVIFFIILIVRVNS